MSTEHQMTLQILRLQAWDRAKGELQSILSAYWSDMDNSYSREYSALSAKIDAFVKDVEETVLM